MTADFTRGVSSAESDVSRAAPSARLRVDSTEAIHENRGVGRLELASTLGPPTEGGRTVDLNRWRCTRCGATRQDWGDHVSVLSGHDDTQSLYRRVPVPRPRDEPPPFVGQVDRQTVSNHFTSLFQWAPQVCQQVLSETRDTYTVLHRAAACLQHEERAQHVSSKQATVFNMLLIGSRLECQWPGLKPTWCNIIFFATGAQPVPLRGIMQIRSALNGSAMIAWQLPSFTGSHISSDWWQLEPQDIYNRVRSEVVAHVDLAHAPRQPEGS